MIHYNLRCHEGHAFDGWFGSSAAFERQQAEAMLTCPACGSADVTRALMAPAVVAKAAPASAPQAQEIPAPATPEANEPPAGTPSSVALLDERAHRVREMIHAVRKAVIEHGVDVGRGFADEARKIHYGEAEPRGIYGQAAPEEARSLLEEGIAILPLPAAPEEAN